MFHFYIDEFSTYCKNLHCANNFVKELLRYVNNFKDYLIDKQVPGQFSQ